MAMCPPGLLPRSQDYESLWHLSTQIADGGQGEIYKTFPKKLNSKYYSSSSLRSRNHIKQYESNINNPKFVTKKIKLSIFGRGGRERIVSHYTFVQKHKLLNIYGIYHDHLNKQILIVMQYLEHELDTKYLIDNNRSTFNHRFSRPGYIYINSELSLKLFIKQISQQLNILHSHNRIHFDLKPQNIMFNAEENKWCIIDYDLMKCITTNDYNHNKVGVAGSKGVVRAGIAGRAGSGLQSGSAKMELDHYRGTQSWTSPEMVVDANRDRPNIVTTKSDIFSFGLIILFIVEFGYQPYLLEEKDVKPHCRELVERPTWRRRKVYYDKLMRNGNGNEYLQEYIHSLYLHYVISDDLCKLLINMLQFDVEKRCNAQQILTDPWLSNTP